MEVKVMQIEGRVAKIEGIVEQMNERLNHIESDLSALREEVRSNFKWTMGLMLTMWLTIILAIFHT
jgi:tetrahydromethanopterin S-methyltransferase subunit B